MASVRLSRAFAASRGKTHQYEAILLTPDTYLLTTCTDFAPTHAIMKKAVTIVTWFYPDQPGYLDFSYRVQALAKRYRVTLISREPIRQVELHSDAIDYVVIPTIDCAMPRHVEYVLRVAAYVRKLKPDMVVLLGSQIAAVKLVIGRIPVAVYWNEHPAHYFPVEEGNAVKRLLRAVLRGLTYRGARRAEVAMPIGEAHYEDLLVHGVSPERLRLIYMGVAAGFSPAPGDSPATVPVVSAAGEPLRLIYTGTVIHERGRDVMLEGLAKANAVRRVATLTMVGALPEQIAYCEARARELGLGDAFRIVGRVPGSAIPALLANADAGICIWEDRLYWRFNPPTKLFEYLVAGLPVVVSNIRTHTDYIRDWENGVVFEYAAESFSERVTELWNRRAELPRMRARALAESDKYLWNTLEVQFLDALPVD